MTNAMEFSIFVCGYPSSGVYDGQVQEDSPESHLFLPTRGLSFITIYVVLTKMGVRPTTVKRRYQWRSSKVYRSFNTQFVPSLQNFIEE